LSALLLCVVPLAAPAAAGDASAAVPATVVALCGASGVAPAGDKTASAPAAPPGPTAAGQQEEAPGRGDDLARIRRWRTFLDRAHRAFFAAHMSTAAVKAKITEADERIEELEGAPADDAGGRSDITGDVAFLERALRAFTAAHMNTADAQRWLEEAREKS
jgi:hypothetical protein